MPSLVSLLEPDSELYGGITDVSYRYPKMYVIRLSSSFPSSPCCGARHSIRWNTAGSWRRSRNQNIDISHFEEEMNDFKTRFGRNYDLASRKFKTCHRGDR